MRKRGFTLVELVVVIAVLGILSITILPRFGDSVGFDRIGFRDQVRVAVQHARKTAVASRRHVCVTVAANSIALTMDPRLPDGLLAPNCAMPPAISLNLPGQSANSIAAPNGANLGPDIVFSFDPLGRPSGAVALNVSGQEINVEAETGYVR